MGIFMSKNKKGFLLIESILLIEIVMVISFALTNAILLYVQENKSVIHNSIEEDAMMRQAYE